MILNWLVTGDTHGDVKSRIEYIKQCKSYCKPEDTAIIILGDAGINYFMMQDKPAKDEIKSLLYYLSNDYTQKEYMQNSGYKFYLVRGNHEQRPELVPNIKQIYDNDVNGKVYYEKAFPNIRYFKDGAIYNINDKNILVIGGAYSIDKYYRLSHGMNWFKDEQLTEKERNKILKNVKNKQFDYIFTHTCPACWLPTDLFLPGIDQSTVDNSMEIWLDTIKESITFDRWLFGHFHADRYYVNEPAIMLYNKVIIDLFGYDPDM